jgi:hypothetical protein
MGHIGRWAFAMEHKKAGHIKIARFLAEPGD